MIHKKRITSAKQLWTFFKEGFAIFDKDRAYVYYALRDNKIYEFTRLGEDIVRYKLNSFVFLCKFMDKKLKLFVWTSRK